MGVKHQGEGRYGGAWTNIRRWGVPQKTRRGCESCFVQGICSSPLRPCFFMPPQADAGVPPLGPASAPSLLSRILSPALAPHWYFPGWLPPSSVRPARPESSRSCLKSCSLDARSTRFRNLKRVVCYGKSVVSPKCEWFFSLTIGVGQAFFLLFSFLPVFYYYFHHAY